MVSTGELLWPKTTTPSRTTQAVIYLSWSVEVPRLRVRWDPPFQSLRLRLPNRVGTASSLGACKSRPPTTGPPKTGPPTRPLTAKIVVDESNKARTLCFVGDLHREQCVVLELLTQHLVLTKWDHLASKVRVKVDPRSFAYPMEVSADELRREQLAILARDAAGVPSLTLTA